jgi:hypothetical protein
MVVGRPELHRDGRLVPHSSHSCPKQNLPFPESKRFQRKPATSLFRPGRAGVPAAHGSAADHSSRISGLGNLAPAIRDASGNGQLDEFGAGTMEPSDPSTLATHQRCVERILATWPDFRATCADRLRHGNEAEKVAEGIIESLFTQVLDWTPGDLMYQIAPGSCGTSPNW